MRNLKLSILVITCISCTNSNNNQPKLINGSIELLMNDCDEMDGYIENRDSFSEKYKTTLVSNDTLFYQTVFEVNRCQKIEPDIQVSLDTLKFGVKDVDSFVCAAIKLVRVKYIISLKGVQQEYIYFDNHW